MCDKLINRDMTKNYESDCVDGIRDTRADIETSKKICIDFDGTCVGEEFPRVGPTVPGAVRVLRALVSKGHRLILWTARSGKLLDDAIEWFNNNGIELYGVNKDPHPLEGWPVPRKVIPAWYIDDRNLCTPMVEISSDEKTYRVVDWNAVERELVMKGIL